MKESSNPAAAASSCVAAKKTREVPNEALYDGLTGLPNRALMLDRAETMLARAGRQSGLLVGALFIDIDWFKDVNEKLGEDAGDQLLANVAERLEAVVRESIRHQTEVLTTEVVAPLGPLPSSTGSGCEIRMRNVCRPCVVAGARLAPAGGEEPAGTSKLATP